MQYSNITGLNCAHCGKLFEAKRKTARYCCQTCKVYASQTRTGRKETTNTPTAVKGISVDELSEKYRQLELECIDLQKQIDTDKENFDLNMNLFQVKRAIYAVTLELMTIGCSGNLLVSHAKNIAFYPFSIGDAPPSTLGNPPLPFIAYICYGNVRGNTNFLLQFAGVLTKTFRFKILFLTESTKKFNSGFDEYNEIKVSIDYDFFTIKSIKNRMDVETTLKSTEFDFLLLDVENIHLDAEYLNTLQEMYPMLSIICTTVKPIQSIIDKANYTLQIKGGGSFFQFSNGAYEMGLNTDWYLGNVPA